MRVSEQIDQKIIDVPMLGMGNLRYVFELVFYRFNEDPWTDSTKLMGASIWLCCWLIYLFYRLKGFTPIKFRTQFSNNQGGYEIERSKSRVVATKTHW